ncbi:MAG: adenylate/guanylate cyclase domain-containing protein [Burkholderiaceae bacterium]
MRDWLWSVPALVVAVGLGVVWWRARRQNAQLERLLGAQDDKLERLQRQFERFVPADVVERLTDANDGFAPERRQVTILFADLCDFTAMSERLDPAVTVGILNGYFGQMIAAIEKHHGHVTELVGDGLLALFGALEPNPWQARDAVLAALEMRRALANYNTELRAKQLPELRFGVGIHCGEVVAGVIGTAGLSKFSVTGDPINVASRIEGLTRTFKVDLLVSDEVRQALDDQFLMRAMPTVQVKGKTDPIQTWLVESLRARGD